MCDHIGFGLSDKPLHGAYSIAEYADNVLATWRHYGIKQGALYFCDSHGSFLHSASCCPRHGIDRRFGTFGAKGTRHASRTRLFLVVFYRHLWLGRCARDPFGDAHQWRHRHGRIAPAAFPAHPHCTLGAPFFLHFLFLRTI